jgi:hypothetical protein
MTSYCKLLDPTNSDDVENLKQILDSYLENESNQINPVYVYDDMLTFINWLKEKFLVIPTSDLVISAHFTNDIIDQVMIGYKLEIAWGKLIAEDTFPYWALALWYKKDASWKSPYDDIHTIEKLMLEHFEKQKYTKGFFVVKAPNKVLRITDSAQAKDYALNIFSETVPALKYDFMIEKIFRTQKDLDNYKFRAIKAMMPKHCLRPIMLMSLDLHHSHRIMNDPNIE